MVDFSKITPEMWASIAKCANSDIKGTANKVDKSEINCLNASVFTPNGLDAVTEGDIDLLNEQLGLKIASNPEIVPQMVKEEGKIAETGVTLETLPKDSLPLHGQYVADYQEKYPAALEKAFNAKAQAEGLGVAQAEDLGKAQKDITNKEITVAQYCQPEEGQDWQKDWQAGDKLVTDIKTRITEVDKSITDYQKALKKDRHLSRAERKERREAAVNGANTEDVVTINGEQIPRKEAADKLDELKKELKALKDGLKKAEKQAKALHKEADKAEEDRKTLAETLEKQKKSANNQNETTLNAVIKNEQAKRDEIIKTAGEETKTYEEALEKATNFEVTKSIDTENKKVSDLITKDTAVEDDKVVVQTLINQANDLKNAPYEKVTGADGQEKDIGVVEAHQNANAELDRLKEIAGQKSDEVAKLRNKGYETSKDPAKRQAIKDANDELKAATDNVSAQMQVVSNIEKSDAFKNWTAADAKAKEAITTLEAKITESANKDFEDKFKTIEAQRKGRKYALDHNKLYEGQKDDIEAETENPTPPAGEVKNDKKPDEVNNDKKPDEVNKDEKSDEVNNDKKPDEVNNDKKPDEVNNDKKPDEVNKDEKSDEVNKDEKTPEGRPQANAQFVVRNGMSVEQLLDLLGLTFEELKELNPDLKLGSGEYCDGKKSGILQSGAIINYDKTKAKTDKIDAMDKGRSAEDIKKAQHDAYVKKVTSVEFLKKNCLNNIKKAGQVSLRKLAEKAMEFKKSTFASEADWNKYLDGIVKRVYKNDQNQIDYLVYRAKVVGYLEDEPMPQRYQRQNNPNPTPNPSVQRPQGGSQRPPRMGPPKQQA